MKRYILFKPAVHVQIGHLYEHIYCHQFAQSLREKGLFAYVDYSIDGKTFFDGYVRVEILLYTKAAMAYKKFIENFTIQIDEDVISGGLLQIMAEKYEDVWDYDDTVILKTLDKFNNDGWLSLYDIEISSFKAHRKTSKGLSFVPRDRRHFSHITQKIKLDISSTSLERNTALALFAVISKSIRENLQEDIASSSFCYSVSDTFTQRGALLIDTNTYRVDNRQSTRLSDENDQVNTTLSLMRERGFIVRLSEFLLNAHTNEPFALPNEEEISTKVSLVVGAEGWRTIGTVDNIKEIFDHISIEMKFLKN
jgi:hypothetical protein